MRSDYGDILSGWAREKPLRGRNKRLNLKSSDMSESRSPLQLAWGILLATAGVGVFFRIPQVMPQIEALETFSGVAGFIRFCFYFIGVMLVGGGIKKIHRHLKTRTDPD